MTTRQDRTRAHARNAFRRMAWGAAGMAPTLLLVSVAALLLLSACGGGGGGGSQAAAAAAEPGVIALTVKDSYGVAVVGARVRSPQGDVITGAQGGALLLTASPGASVNVTVSRESFVDRAVALASTVGRVNDVTVTLDRATSAAGASLTTRSGAVATVDSTGQQVTFEVEVAVVGADAQPIPSLSAAAFALRPCQPVATNDVADCVRGATASEDVAFVPVSTAPAVLTPVPAGSRRPFATAMLLDQSGSIAQTDPTGARLYSAKAFLDGLNPQDQVVLAAFAGAPGALIPSAPLVVYGPFRGQAQASSYYATLDTLAPLVGGNTPLYDSIDTVRQQWLDNAVLADGMRKSLLVFTDGADTTCTGLVACRLRREQTIIAAKDAQVRIFAIGLSAGADVAALGELANETGGALLYADNVAQLVPLYGSVGTLMSGGLATYRLQWTVRTDTVGGFRAGQALVGRVQVTAGTSTFDVPFVVALP